MSTPWTPRRPRPPPTLRALVAPRWRVERRPGEPGAGWQLLAAPGSAAVARDEAACPRAPVAFGDLLRVVGPRGATLGFWVVGPAGPVDAGRVAPARGCPPGYDWAGAWEGPDARPEDMLERLTGVPRAGLPFDLPGRRPGPPGRDGAATLDPARAVLVGIDCACHVLDREPGPVDSRTWAAIAEARGWALVPAARTESAGRALAAALAAAQAVRGANTPDTLARAGMLAAWAARDAMLAPAGHDAVPDVARAVEAAAKAWSVPPREASRDLAAVVRRWAPLPVALLARAGVAVPLGAGFW